MNTNKKVMTLKKPQPLPRGKTYLEYKKKRRIQRRENLDYSQDRKSPTGEIADIVSGGKFEKWERVVSMLKAVGPDVRLPDANTGGLFQDSVNEVCKISVMTSNEPIIGIAVSCLSHALSLGYRDYCMYNNLPDNPYFAFLFIYNVVLQVMQGNQSAVPKVNFPDFLLEILAAVNPKSGVQSGSGVIGYSWQVENASNQPGREFTFPLSNPAGIYFIGNATNTLDVSGYNVMVMSSGAYNTENGQNAFSDMMNFINKRLLFNTKRYHPYALRTYDLKGTLLERSCSAFADISAIVGSGVGPGAPYSLAASETPNKNPKFSVFASDKNLKRGFKFYKASGGDSTALVGNLIHQVFKSEVFNPNYMCFKPVDFYEFADRVATYYAKALGYAAIDTMNQTYPVNLGLTGTEFLVILRKILMDNFNDTQWFVQSLRFYGGTDDFNPFLVSTATSCANMSTSLTIPLALQENLNSLRARSVCPNINPRTMKTVKRNPRIYVPVLGSYTKYDFNVKNYTYLDKDNNPVEIFTGPGASVSLIDGSVGGGGNNNTFVDLDGSAKIFADMSKLDTVTNRLSSYLQQPKTYTGDGGVNVLTVIAESYIVDELKTDEQSTNNNNNASSKNHSILQKMSNSPKQPQITVFDKKVVSRIGQQVPIKEIYGIKKLFVTPEYRLVLLAQNIGSVTADTMRVLNSELWQLYMGQVYANSQDGTYVDMKIIRNTFCDICVKFRDAEDHEIVKSLMDLSALGKAGIFGSAVGLFGGELAKAGLSALGSYLPF